MTEPFGHRFKNLSADEAKDVFDHCKAQDLNVGDLCETSYGYIVVLHPTYPYICHEDVLWTEDPRQLRKFKPGPQHRHRSFARLYEMQKSFRNGQKWGYSQVD